MLNVSGQEIAIDSKIIAIRQFKHSCRVEFERYVEYIPGDLYYVFKVLGLQDSWFSVEDRLPRKMGWYICVCNCEIDHLHWSGANWWSKNSIKIESISHWMYDPELPKF